MGDGIDDEQDEAGELHADDDEMLRGEGALLQHELGGDAGAAPEDGAAGDEQHAFMARAHGRASSW